jgi:hypothetical protein
MTYKGHVENGKVVFDEPAPLAEGTRVRIEVAAGVVPEVDSGDGDVPSLAERLASVIGTAEGLPEDAAENLDHYLYGTPKQR